MNPSLASRLRIGFGLVLVLLVAVTVVGVGRLFQLRQDFEDSTSRAFELELAVENMRSSFVFEQAAVRRATGERRAGRADYRQALATARKTTAAARRLASGEPEAERLIERRAAAVGRWRAANAQPVLGGRAPPTGRERVLASAVVRSDNGLIEHQRERRSALRNDANDDTRATSILVFVGLICAFVAALLIFAGLVNSMRRPVAELVRAAKRLASGDLDTRVDVSGPVETQTLGTAFNEMASELEEAYGRIEDARHRLEVMIESLSDGLVTIDSEGRVSQVNPAARRMLPAARPGAEIAEALGPLAPSSEELERMIRGGHRGEFRLADTERVLAVAVSPLGGRAGGAVFSMRDVSERARVEHMKDEFVTTVSHELRSPLTSIMGFAELLMMDREKLSPEQAENVEIITESTRQLIGVVNDLLDLARSDAGRLTIDPKPCEVGPIVEDVAKLMRPRIREKRQKLDVEVEPDLPPVLAEPDRVKQILGNLLTNAHLYTEERGSIELGAVGRDGEVELRVSDTGSGMSEEQLEHVFDRFWRADSGERQRAGGAGIGLAVVKSLVDLHGGEISVDSSEGRGTTFQVRLPVAGPEASSGERPR